MKTKLLLLIAGIISINSFAQFGSQQIVTSNANGARSVFSADIDGDGDMDILSASDFDDKIAWYENMDGKGNFGAEQIISTDADGAKSVYATDIDGDGDMDVISVSNTAALTTDKLAWYENLDGKGTFGAQQILPTSTTPTSVYAADIDNDGDMDLIWSAQRFDRISWLENTDGKGTFELKEISKDADRAQSVFSVDIDGDGDMDVLSASFGDDKIAWYENTDGKGNFSSEKIITTDADGAQSVFSVDLDGDGDMDVLSASDNDNKIAWYENTDGLGNFGSQQIITTDAERALSVYSVDLDGDGDMDVLSASANDDKIAWYENTDGKGNFGSQQIITTNADLAWSVYAVDIDGDGDMDVLSASFYDDKIAWYENTASAITETYVPDDNFEQVLIDLGYDTLPLDDYVPTANINTITDLDVTGKSITDLTGIDGFTSLLNLTCDNNPLTAINLDQNTNLGSLRCRNTDITSLDLSKNTELKFLFCNDNQLTNLHISNCVNLDWLECHNNKLGSLNVDNNPELRTIQAGNNQMNQINVDKNTKLTQLLLYSNQLSTIDIDKNSLLESINISNNSISNLNSSLNTKLTQIICFDNQIESLDVSKNTLLERFNARNNKLTFLNFKNGNNTIITQFISTGNPNLTCIEVDDKTYSTANWTDIDATSSFINNQAECNALAIDNIKIDGFKMYPNPVRNQLTIIGKNMIINEVGVFDYTGRVVKNIKWNGNSTNLSELSPGIYLLKIRTNQGTTNSKLIKM
ncbi:MAG: T9SS type A sorting domain-containing protein [Flavobacteriaceae bacterium]|nr:T9SS type A sorting domain-containing protein [Flavobacteriaceae bacterium]